MLTKADAPDGHDRTLLVSSDGAKRVAVHVIHDLPHLVVESVFGITDGLWGELARGEHVDAGRAACARSAGRRKLGRIVSGAASGASTNMWLSDGHRLAKAVTNAVVNRGQDGPDTPDGVRARLSKDAGPASAELLGSVNDATIQLAIDGVHRVYEQWAQTPPGESLRLSWPLPPGFRELAERA